MDNHRVEVAKKAIEEEYQQGNINRLKTEQFHILIAKDNPEANMTTEQLDELENFVSDKLYKLFNGEL